MTSDVKLQNYLSEATDAILSGQPIERVRDAYPDLAEAEELLMLIDQINQVFVPVDPPKQFKSRLKNELLDMPRDGVYWRLRRLPARVHLAAVAAIVGGFILLLQRLLLGDNAVRREKRNALSEET